MTRNGRLHGNAEIEIGAPLTFSDQFRSFASNLIKVSARAIWIEGRVDADVQEVVAELQTSVLSDITAANLSTCDCRTARDVVLLVVNIFTNSRTFGLGEEETRSSGDDVVTGWRRSETQSEIPEAESVECSHSSGCC